MAIGRRATSELIVYTQSFKGMTNYRQPISYAGVKPKRVFERVRVSGAEVRSASRAAKLLRNILYMCSLSTVKSNHACKRLYERLIVKEKNKKLALIAV